MTDLVTMTMTKALKGAGYVSVDADTAGIAGKNLGNKKMASSVAKTIAGMTDDWDLVRIEKNGTLTFARWSAEDCELLATTPAGLVIAAAHCKPQCLDWFLAAAAAHIRKD